MESSIVRTLAEGPDYAPNWRERQVEQYVADVVLAKDPACRLLEILWEEPDPFVRQYLRFRHDGKCANREAFTYAAGCQVRNKEDGAASMIKAMVVADRTPEE